MKGTTWSEKDIEYLETKWGLISIPAIAKNLNRSVNAVKLKAQRMRLGSYLENGDYITLHQLLKGLGLDKSYSWYIEKFLEADLPYFTKKRMNTSVRVINLEKFWKWAEKNKKLLDFKDFEENILGEEPEWVKDKRNADIAAGRYNKASWTKEEDAMLKSLLSHYRFGYKQISQRLNRTEGAVKRRICDLGLKARPVKANNHNPWRSNELEYVKDMHIRGYNPDVIAQGLEYRSAIAVRGILERIGML